MATYTTNRTATNVPARNPQSNGTWYDAATYEASALVTNDVIQMVKVPPGITVDRVEVVHDALGANTALEVGDGSDTDRFITAFAAATSTINDGAPKQGGAFPYAYTEYDTLDVKSVGVGNITGTITLKAWGHRGPVDLS